MAFPHMFPAATNQWKPNVDKDPATDTFAAPEVWTKFADFYKRSTEASKLAYDCEPRHRGGGVQGRGHRASRRLRRLPRRLS